MVYFPADESFTLEEFVRKQEMYINEKLSFLQAKNLEIEVSINDLLDIIEQFKINENIEPSDKELVKNAFLILAYKNNIILQQFNVQITVILYQRIIKSNKEKSLFKIWISDSRKAVF